MKYRAWFSIICEPTERAKKFGVIKLRHHQTLAVEAKDMADALIQIGAIFKEKKIDADVIKIRVHPSSQLGDR